MSVCGTEQDDGNCILGPELKDISSTAARDASVRGDSATLLSMLHPAVADWLLKSDGHKGLTDCTLQMETDSIAAEPERRGEQRKSSALGPAGVPGSIKAKANSQLRKARTPTPKPSTSS